VRSQPRPEYTQAYNAGKFLAGNCIYKNCFICQLPKCERKDKEVKKEEETMTLSTTLSALQQVPPKPKGTHNISKYYDEHRKEITAEIKAIGKKAALYRWNIGDATWHNYLKRAEMSGIVKPETVSGTDEPKIKEPEPISSDDIEQSDREFADKLKNTITDIHPPRPVTIGVLVINRELPSWPPFEACEDGSVQLEWMNGYLELAKMSQVPVGMQ